MHKLSTQNLITIGIFTALYFVVVSISSILTLILIPGVSFLFISGIAALCSGPIYFLVIAKITKFGAISIMGSVLGIFFLVSGHASIAFLTCIITAIIADFIANIKAYKNFHINMISFILFSFGTIGTILPMWIFKTQYISQGEKYAARYLYITPWTLFLVFLFTIICSIVSSYISRKILKKHFEKAGMI